MKFKFIAFDLDGVLVSERSSWEWVHHHMGVDNEEGYRLFMDGKIDDHEFMKRDVDQWKSVDPDINIQRIEDILMKARLTPGIVEAIRILKDRGSVIGIISGGIDILADHVGKICDVDHVIANGLATDDYGKLTGGGISRVLLMDKGSALKEMLATANIDPKDCAVIGNSCIDISMFEVGAFSIAFNPIDEETIRSGDVVIHSDDMRDILPYLI